MDTVLGLVVTPTNVQTVLVEGQSADGATLEHDEFDVYPGGGEPATRASEQVAEAVLTIAEAEGQRLHSIGVTWSDDADREASLLLDSLAGLGLQNIVLVKQPQAAEALAASIGRVMGYQRTAVCVVEPDSVMMSLVDSYDEIEETLVSRSIDSSEELIDWVSSIFERDDWRPDGLFVVGSVGDLDLVARELEAALSLPVFDPPEAELALAHGAALASATSADCQSLFTDDMLTEFTASDYTDGEYPPRQSRAKSKYTAPMAMLVGGAVTFVVSASLALSLHLGPDNAISVENRDVAKTAGTPAALPILPVLPAAPPPAIPMADTPPPEAIEPAPEAVPAPAPEAPYIPEPDAGYQPEPVAEVPAYEPPPAYVPPAYVPPPAPQVIAPPQPQTPVRSWLKEKLHLGN